jgi:hypothetical protein
VVVKTELDKMNIPFLMQLVKPTPFYLEMKKEKAKNLINLVLNYWTIKLVKLLERIKNLIVALVHHQDTKPKLNLSFIYGRFTTRL